MTDPIADLLTRIRNGAQRPQGARRRARGRGIKEAHRRACWSTRATSTSAASWTARARQATLRVGLRYDEQRRPVINGIQRVSRPSLRVYVGADEIPPIRARPRRQRAVDAAGRAGRPRGAQAAASAASCSARCGRTTCRASASMPIAVPSGVTVHVDRRRPCAVEGPEGQARSARCPPASTVDGRRRGR